MEVISQSTEIPTLEIVQSLSIRLISYVKANLAEILGSQIILNGNLNKFELDEFTQRNILKKVTELDKLKDLFTLAIQQRLDYLKNIGENGKTETEELNILYESTFAEIDSILNNASSQVLEFKPKSN